MATKILVQRFIQYNVLLFTYYKYNIVLELEYIIVDSRRIVYVFAYEWRSPRYTYMYHPQSNFKITGGVGIGIK